MKEDTRKKIFSSTLEARVSRVELGVHHLKCSYFASGANFERALNTLRARLNIELGVDTDEVARRELEPILDRKGMRIPFQRYE